MLKVKVIFTGKQAILNEDIVITQEIAVSSELAADIFAEAFLLSLLQTNFMKLCWDYRLEAL